MFNTCILHGDYLICNKCGQTWHKKVDFPKNNDSLIVKLVVTDCHLNKSFLIAIA